MLLMMLMMATVVMEIVTVDVVTADVVAFFSFLTSWLAKVEQLDGDDD